MKALLSPDMHHKQLLDKDQGSGRDQAQSDTGRAVIVQEFDSTRHKRLLYVAKSLWPRLCFASLEIRQSFPARAALRSEFFPRPAEERTSGFALDGRNHAINPQ